MINIHKDIALNKLKKAGVKIKYKSGTRQPIALSIDSRRDIGLKMLAYVDYIGLPLQRKQKKQRKRSYLTEKKKEIIHKIDNVLHRIRWFNTKEDAEVYVADMKMKSKGIFLRSDMHLTDFNEYRVIFQTRIKDITIRSVL